MSHALPAATILLLLGFPLWRIAGESPILSKETMPSYQKDDGPRSISLTVDSSFEPIWPTNTSRRINSSFAEFRRTHFHAGIDISTNNRTGHPVYAAEDGFIASIQVSPSGYGKAVFIQHPNGYVSIYAHLKTFNALLNSVVEELQERVGKYAVEHRFEIGDVVVRKGEVIAFSGDTGTGSAHLHFEIRDQHYNPLNPLLFQALRPVDTTPPIIRKLAASPLNAYSSVAGEHRSKIYTVTRKNKNLYQLSAPLYAAGDIGLAVETQDRLDGSWRNLGVQRIELSIDDERLFMCEYNRIVARQSKQVALHFDWPLLNERRGRYRKLYVERGDELNWYEPGETSAGVLSTGRFTKGAHDLRIVCTDAEGNSSELRGTLVLNERPAVQVVESHSPPVLEFEQPDHIQKVHVSGRSLIQKTWITSTFKHTTTDDNRWTVPTLKKTFDVLKIIAEDRWGTRSAPNIYYLRKPKGNDRSISIEKSFVRDFIVVTVKTDGQFTAAPLLRVDHSGGVSHVAVVARNEREYFGPFRPPDEVTGSIHVHVQAEVDGLWKEAEEEFTIYPIAPRQEPQTVYDDGELLFTALPRASYGTIFCRIEKRVESGKTIYSLLPDDQLLNSGVRVTLRAGEHFTRFDKLGIYLRTGGGWQFVNSAKDSVARTLTTTLQRTLGEVTLREDLESPTIRSLRIRAPQSPEISFAAIDDGSGVDADAIEMYIDDKRTIPEYEAETHRVTYRPKTHFGKGSHTLLVAVRDKVGNQTKLTKTFRTSQ